MNENSITTVNLYKYGLLAAPVAFAGFPLYVLAPDFFATEYGISLASLGFVLLFLRLFDAFQDPVIGIISDRWRNHIAYILVPSAVLLVMSIYGLFNLSYFSPLFWFVLCMGIAVTSYSILSINLNALGALWTESKEAQTRIAAIREAFSLFGLILAVSLPTLLLNVAPEHQIYQWFGLILALLMMGCLITFLNWNRTTRKNIQISTPNRSIITNFTKLPPNTKILMMVYLFSMVASSIPAVLVIFFVRDLLGVEAYSGLFLLLYFLSGAIFIPMWKRISQSQGKFRSWFLSMLFASGSFVWVFFLGTGDIWQFAVICVVSGAAFGADLIFPPAILADQVHASNATNSASSYYATLTLTAKSSLALASAVSLPMLESFGFTPDSENSSSALLSLSASYALVPCILKCGAALLLWRKFIHPQNGVAYENIQINHPPRSHPYAQ